MNDVNKNRINNYLYCYSIQNNEENFNKLAEVITKKEYFVYRKSITVEIGLLEHNHLLKDITRKFFAKKISTQKFVKKLITHTLLEILF